MTYQEANRIIQAAVQHKIFTTCRSEGDIYIINIMDRMDFRSFQAAKLAINSLVLEFRAYPPKQKETATFTPNPKRRRKNDTEGNWGENRVKS